MVTTIHLRTSFATTLGKYGDGLSRQLYRAWFDKMQWLFDRFLSEPEGFIQADALVAEFKEDDVVPL